MIIDSHCHLDYVPLSDELDKVIDRANNIGVKYFLTISTTLASYKKIKNIINKYNCVYGTVGIHPHETKNHKEINSKEILNLKKNQNKVIGIGETGLDFYYNHSDKDIQKKIFIEHIKSAIDLNIPLIVHSRNAEEDTYDILKYYSLNKNLKILMHCFTGSKVFASKLLDLGAYISFSGIITFKNSKELVSTALFVPFERILVETDSPYLSPVPNRGKTNEPSNIIYTVKKLSQIKNKDIELTKKITSNNFLNLFSLNLL